MTLVHVYDDHVDIERPGFLQVFPFDEIVDHRAEDACSYSCTCNDTDAINIKEPS